MAAAVALPRLRTADARRATPARAQNDGLLLAARDVPKAAKQALDVLAGAVSSAGGEAARFAVAMKRSCVALTAETNPAATHEGALKLLAALLSAGDARLPPGVCAELRLAELSYELRARLYSSAKLAAGARAATLRVLGVLAERYADAVPPAPSGSRAARAPLATLSLPTFLRALAKEQLAIQLDKDEPENLVVAGVLDALSAALTALPPGGLPADEATAALATCIKVISPDEKSTRYECARACVRDTC